MRKIILGFIVLCFSYVAIGQERVLIDSVIFDNGIAYYKSNLFTGITFKKYENGQLLVESNFKNGKPHGIGKMWHNNGQLKQESNYKDGKKISIKYWNKKGKETSKKCWNEEGKEKECD